MAIFERGVGVVILALAVAGGAGAQTPMSRDSFDAEFREVSNWGRWGADDSLGTLNLITPQKRAAAARSVREGRTISLARLVRPGPNSNAIEPVTVRFCRPRGGDIHWLLDAPTLPMHGWAFSHLDALAHLAYHGQLYNGFGDSTIDSTGGATRLGIAVQHEGIVSRGVLIDVPRLRRVPYLDTNDVVTAAELESWERQTGVHVEPGDIVLIRTGRDAREAARGAWRIVSGTAGLHPEVARWLRARGVAALGSDVSSEHYPSLVPGVSDPIHVLTLGAMGMPLLDNLALEEAANEAAEHSRYTFMLVVAPVPVIGGSGSLLTALAIF